MSHEVPLQQMVINDLAQRCEQETNLYFKRQVHDTGYCFELFRRAIQEGNDDAWEIICKQYQALVTGWVDKHYGFTATGEKAEYFVNGAFIKIFGTITPDKFRSFSDLGYLLRYLKMCVHSVIMDYTRALDYTALYDLDEAAEERSADPLPEEQAIDHSNRRTLWKSTQERLHDNQERAVIEGSFAFELKPQEIYEHYRGVFSDVAEVYRVKQNVISRLRRDSEFRKLLGLDD